MKVYKFNDCYLDTIERRVFKNGQLIEMTPRAFDVLQLLVESSGRIVTKNDLIREVWHDSFIEEGNIPVHISKLRKTLGAGKSQRFIETVSGVGYHFAARVSTVSEEDWGKHLAQNKKSPTVKDSSNSNLDSIAVLPFQNVGDKQEIEYLAEGLTENIINNLSYIPEIKVLARNTVFRFKDSAMDAQEIGASLQVAAVLTGRVKILGENIVISAELMKVSDGAQLWGKQFNQPFSDIFEIQEKIAHSISETLRLQISDFAKISVQSQVPRSVKAYTQYLKGRHFWLKMNFADINNGIKYFQESIATDPSYTTSYIGLANCYISLYQLEYLSRERTLSLVNTIFDRVAEFDENMPETLVTIGFAKLTLEWDWKNAEICHQKSIALNPNNATARFRYGNLLALKGGFAESITQLRQALQLDPLSTIINASLGRVFYLMEQFDNAINQLQETLELDPKNYLTLMLLGVSLAEKGRYTEALDVFHAARNSLKSIEVLSMIGYVHALAGREGKARQVIKQVEEESNVKNIDAINLAYVHTALGEIERSFVYLEKAFRQRSTELVGVKVDPRLKPLRHDPRFKNLVRRVGLPVS